MKQTVWNSVFSIALCDTVFCSVMLDSVRTGSVEIMSTGVQLAVVGCWSQLHSGKLFCVYNVCSKGERNRSAMVEMKTKMCGLVPLELDMVTRPVNIQYFLIFIRIWTEVASNRITVLSCCKYHCTKWKFAHNGNFHFLQSSSGLQVHKLQQHL